MYFATHDKAECCGCTSCQSACPMRAIDMLEDNEGFYYPKINLSKCISCGLCERVCPVESPQYTNYTSPKVFASILKDVEQRKLSSSGGLFYAIASWVIKQGGIVYGASMNEDFNVQHIGVETIGDLDRLRGSKYVQSNMEGVYPLIEEQLKENRLVYFVGTGCQVAGLNAFLKNKRNNLITSDLVCHGVPSSKLFRKHIDYLQRKYKGEITYYSFRDSSVGNVCEIVKIRKNIGYSRTIKHFSYDLSPYLFSFMHAYTYRLSCYRCPFAKLPRQGDITLADFWGVKEFFPDIDNSKGTSLVLVNSPTGESVWEHVKEKCDSYVSTVFDAAKNNGNLLRPTNMPQTRLSVYGSIDKIGYDKVAVTLFRSPKYRTMKVAGVAKSIGVLGALIRIKHIFSCNESK